MLESLEDLIREVTDALSGKRAMQRELFAGTTAQELSEHLLETEEDVKSFQDQALEKLNAKVWLKVKLSENGLDKANTALPTEEEPTDGLDAHGERTSKTLESLEDSTEVT